MKKKIFSIIIITVVTMITSLNITQSNKEVMLSDLALDNVEALADPEDFPGTYIVEVHWQIEGYGNTTLIRTCRSGGTSYC